jgi:Kyakuja-Dileera-Zisupton transposase
MDYIIFLSIQSCSLCRILLLYDIFCQWSKKQPQCHTKLPLALQLSPDVHLSSVVLKFHLPAHKQKCYTKFSLNLHPGAGHMDGEGIEHNWANLNLAASSMKEMSKGSHHDTINDLFRD